MTEVRVKETKLNRQNRINDWGSPERPTKLDHQGPKCTLGVPSFSLSTEEDILAIEKGLNHPCCNSPQSPNYYLCPHSCSLRGAYSAYNSPHGSPLNTPKTPTNLSNSDLWSQRSSIAVPLSIGGRGLSPKWKIRTNSWSSVSADCSKCSSSW